MPADPIKSIKARRSAEIGHPVTRACDFCHVERVRMMLRWEEVWSKICLLLTDFGTESAPGPPTGHSRHSSP